MAEFVYLFRASAAEHEEHMGTPDQAQKSMEAWLAWMRELEAGGHVKDPGQPLERAGKVVRGAGMVTDGPFIETKDLVLGYMVLIARDLAHAAELAAGCPMIQGGGGAVEIRPVASMSM
jgi:hypothetical protein